MEDKELTKEQKQKEAREKIANILEDIDKLVTEAETIADEANIGIHWDGFSYGMGGYYTPNKKKTEGVVDEAEDDDDWESSSAGKWVSSSENC